MFTFEARSLVQAPASCLNHAKKRQTMKELNQSKSFLVSDVLLVSYDLMDASDFFVIPAL